MTICVAGICEENKKNFVVMAADRMLTETGALRVEFETNQVKGIKISENCIALTAGSALTPSEIQVKINRKKESDSEVFCGAIPDVVDNFKETIAELHQEKATDMYLKPVGLSMEDYKRLANTGLGGALYEKLAERRIRTYSLLGGVDKSGGHIYLVVDPAGKACFNDVGFHAIGSGEGHARSSLVFNGFGTRKISLHEGIFLIYEAKKKAEVAPGVGSGATDMWVISKNTVKKVSPQILDNLDRLKEERDERNKKFLEKIVGELEDLKVEDLEES